MLAEIVKTEKLEYWATIRYLFLKELRSKWIYKYKLYTIGEQCPSYATA